MKIKYPATKTVKVIDKIFDKKIPDPYRWLESLDNTEVKKWINNQNKLTRSIIDSLSNRKELIKEFFDILSIERVSLPRIYGENCFFSKRKGKENHSVVYLSKNEFTPDNNKIVLDPNKFSKNGTVALDWYYPSSDGRYIAYGKSEKGSEASTLYILDVKKNKHIKDIIPNTKWTSLVWLKDNSGFYYTRNIEKEKYRPQVFIHKLETRWQDDLYVFGKGLSEEEIPAVYLSADEKFIFITVEKGWIRNDLYCKKLDSSDSFKTIVKGIDAKFWATIVDDIVVVKTNYKTPKFRIMWTTIDKPEIKNWKDLIPESNRVIEDFEIVDKKIVLTLYENTYNRLFVYSLKGKLLYEIKMPALGSISFSGKSYNKPELFYYFTSFFYPPTIYKINLSTQSIKQIYKHNSEFDPKQYTQKFIFYKSKDGTKVPMYIIHRKNIKLNGNNPTILTGYGGFAIGMSPNFADYIVPWFVRGGIYVEAGLRGGNEFGENWHRAGMRANKQNVFDDFIYAAEYLIKNKYTNSKKLAIQGGSNGGLLVGAALTQRPDLFRTVACSMPLLDMIRYHKFGVAHIWMSEYGNPDKKDEFSWLYAYSPYHHVEVNKSYPAVFFQAGDSDGRTHPAHAMKMAAKMQKITGKNTPILLYVEHKGGHGSGKPLKKLIELLVDRLSFIMWQLDMLRK
ncbi:MAG: prolyl oligopeptidase family serine peptidase [bacterium]|nr:prolyl oligopeptidase family serine peptidase [bacterium]